MKYDVEIIKTSEIKPYEKNAKMHDDEQVEQIAKSIQQFGFRQNLVIDKNNVVIIGHGRLLAAKKLGLEYVPCVRATDLTKKQIQALRIADNKIQENGYWDHDLLAQELKDIGEEIQMTDFGFEPFELELDDYINEIDDFSDYEEGKTKSTVITIVCVDEEEENFVKNLVKEDKDLKKIYKAGELIKKYGENK